MTTLDRTTGEDRLFDEIRRILISLPTDTATITVYIPLEGPTPYSYVVNGKTVKGVFEGDYTKHNVKSLVNIVKRGKYDLVKVSSAGLYSYHFSISTEVEEALSE